MGLEAGAAAFLEGKGALIVGFVDAAGWPLATRGWGVSVLSAEEGRIRLMIDEEELDDIAHLAAGGEMAITSADVPTLRSCQVKGVVDSIQPATEADLEVADVHCHAVFTDIALVDHIAYELIQRIRPYRFVALDVTVGEVYDQTPGPGAGAPISELPA